MYRKIHKIWLRFLRYARAQTDIEAYRHANCNTSHPSRRGNEITRCSMAAKRRSTYRTLSSSRLPCTHCVLCFASSATRLFNLEVCLPNTNGDASTDRWEVSDGRPEQTGDCAAETEPDVSITYLQYNRINPTLRSTVDVRPKTSCSNF